MEKYEHFDSFSLGGKAIKIVIGAVSGTVAAVLLALIFSLIFTLASVPDSLMTVAAYTCAAVSAFVCGLVAVGLIKSAGLVNGVIAGAVYFILYSVLSAFFGSAPFFSAQTAIMLVICVIMSALGGILAVNVR